MTNEQKPIIEFKGVNGKVELYDKFIRLDRGTVMGFLTQGLKGKKDIYFKNITSIQIKKPGLTSGYLQLSLAGGIESRGGVFSASGDENTIMFINKDYEKALKIKEYIEKNAHSNDTDSHHSVADEIKKLNELKKSGAITPKEYEKMKEKLMK